MAGQSLYETLRYKVVPPAFLIFFTVVTQVLVVVGNPDLEFGLGSVFGRFFSLGSVFAWQETIL
jgi:hypothetical protein